MRLHLTQFQTISKQSHQLIALKINFYPIFENKFLLFFFVQEYEKEHEHLLWLNIENCYKNLANNHPIKRQLARLLAAHNNKIQTKRSKKLLKNLTSEKLQLNTESNDLEFENLNNINDTIDDSHNVD